MNAPHRAADPLRRPAPGGPRRWPTTWIALLLPLLIPAAHAQEPSLPAIDALFRAYDHTHSPGAAVIVVLEGRVLHARGYGMASLEQGIPITPHTVFDAASVAKQFTGFTLARLIEDGVLSPEASLHTWLPDVPDFGRPITVGDLIHHTSGLRDWPETLAFSGYPLEGPITLDTIFALVRRQRDLDFAPGTDHLYSNTGYNLLAAIVEKATGESLAAWTGTRLFQPFNMRDTRFPTDPGHVTRHLADSYRPASAGRWKRVGNRLAAAGSSSLLTTAADLGQWLLHWESPRDADRPVFDRLSQPGRLAHGAEVNYGYGVGLGTFRGVRRWMHTGGWAGYRSVVLRLPDLGLGLAILGNAANLDVVPLADAIAEACLGSRLPPAPTPTAPPETATGTDPARWTSYPGTYALGPDWLLTVTLDDGTLYAQATREARFPTRPLSDTEFHVDAYGASLRFQTNANGGTDALRYRDIVAPRMDPTGPTPAQLASFAGRYWSPETATVMSLNVGGDALWTSHSGQAPVRLFPTGPDRFGAREGARLEFERTTNGPPAAVRLSGHRVRNLRFLRVDLPDPTPPPVTQPTAD